MKSFACEIKSFFTPSGDQLYIIRTIFRTQLKGNGKLSFHGSSQVMKLAVFCDMFSTPDTYTQFRKDVETRSKIRVEKRMPDKLKPLPAALDGISENLPTLHDLQLKGI